MKLAFGIAQAEPHALVWRSPDRRLQRAGRRQERGELVVRMRRPQNLRRDVPTRARSRSKPRPVTSTPQGRDVGETRRFIPRLGSATEHKTDEPYNFLTPGPDGLPSPAPAGVGVGRGLLLRGPTGEWANPGLGTRPGIRALQRGTHPLSFRPGQRSRGQAAGSNRPGSGQAGLRGRARLPEIGSQAARCRRLIADARVLEE